MSPFIDWVKNVVHDHPMDVNNLEDLDRVLICSRPSQTTTQYTWMKAYKNHFRVEDSKSNSMQTFVNGVALVFDVLTFDFRDLSLNFVGVLKDKLKLDTVKPV
jgi:hypothetical protein